MTERPSAPYLIADHLALDFLNSSVARSGEADWLADGALFLDWSVQAGAIDDAVTRQFRAEDGAFGALDGIAGQARQLRDWLRDFVARHAGDDLGADAAAEIIPLNRLLAHDETYRLIEAAAPEIDERGRWNALRWRQMRRWTTPDRLLMPIAEAIGDLVCHADFRLVRACEGADCVLVFYDRTKAHARRWCSMALCGNRAKAAAHRAKSRRQRPRAT